MRDFGKRGIWTAVGFTGGIFGACGVMAPTSAQAQDQEDVVIEAGPETQIDTRIAPPTSARFLEDPLETVIQQKSAPMQVGVPVVKVVSASEVIGFENRDFRALDERNDEAVFYSDDRTNTGYTDVAVSLAYRVNPKLRFDTQLKYNLLWRDDRLGRSNGVGGGVQVFRLNFDYTFIEGDDFNLTARFGRQPFRIGGVPKEYMLEGTMDGLTFDVGLGKAGSLRIMAIDFYAANDLPISGVRTFKDGSDTVFGLRGETVTYRTGAVYDFDTGNSDEGRLDLRAYYFYASIGGGPIEESGADISFGGKNGNFRDRDYQHLGGGRVAYQLPLGGGTELQFYGEFARSEGIDRQNPVLRDVDTGGNAYGGGVQARIQSSDDLIFFLQGDGYHFDGAKYGSDGLEYERGFVSFRGNRVGGFAIGRLSVWRPSAALDTFGVDASPNELFRVSGTEFLHFGAGTRVGGFTLRADTWLYTDTSSSEVNFGAGLTDLPELPFGVSKAQVAAQERFGKALGQEFNLSAGYEVDANFRLYADLGLFMPGAFYEIEIDPAAAGDQTMLGGTETFWAGRAGAMVTF
ncbi:MAG: hypothetical protein ACE366_13190 [Bradymonadia bacterium]